MKARDTAAVFAIRATLAAIDNAESMAVDVADATPLSIEQSPEGVGALEVPRRTLTPDEVTALVEHEIAERHSAAATYADAGEHDAAERLRAEAVALTRLLGPSSAT